MKRVTQNPMDYGGNLNLHVWLEPTFAGGGDPKKQKPVSLAQAYDPVVGFHLNNGPDEASPMASVGVAEGSFQRNRHRGGSDIVDFHIRFMVYRTVQKSRALDPRKARNAPKNASLRPCNNQV